MAHPQRAALKLRCEVVQMVADHANVPLRVRTAPPWMLRVMGLFNPIMREMVELSYEFQEPYIVDDSRFVQTFGNIATPLAQGIDETLAWFRQRHAD